MSPLYGRSKKGKPIYEKKPLYSSTKINTIASLTMEGIQSVFSFTGYLSAKLFVHYLEQFPLYSKKVLIMEHSPVHHSKSVKEYIEKHKINVLFLPPYSPD